MSGRRESAGGGPDSGGSRGCRSARAGCTRGQRVCARVPMSSSLVNAADSRETVGEGIGRRNFCFGGNAAVACG